MPTIRDLIETVIRNDYCVGCGLCAYLRPSLFDLRFDWRGQYKVFTNHLTADQLAMEVPCPFADDSPNETTIAKSLFADCPSWHELVGHYRSLMFCHVKDENLRLRASSGAFATWLSCQLMDRRLVDGIVHVFPTGLRPIEGPLVDYRISWTPEDVRAATGSRYYPVQLRDILQMLGSINGRFAITAIPCFAKAIRMLQDREPIWKEKIRFVLGLLCGHMKSARFAEFIAWQCGLNPAELRCVQFRGKVPGVRPTNFQYIVAGAQEGSRAPRPMFHNDLEGTDWGQGYFKYLACDYCDDVFCETADVAIGDAWLDRFMSDWRGNNVVVVRNAVLDQIIHEGIQAGELEAEQTSADEVVKTQRAAVRHRRLGLAYRLMVADRAGHWRPRKRVSPSAALPKLERTIFDLRMKIRDATQCSSVDEDRYAFVKMAMRVHPLVARYKDAYRRYRAARRPRRAVSKVMRDVMGLARRLVRCTVLASAISFMRIRHCFAKQKALVVVPAKRGSLGDEAIVTAVVDSLLARGTGPITLAGFGDWHEWHSLKGVQGYQPLPAGTALRSTLGILRRLARYRYFILLGADILDGQYGQAAAAQRLRLLEQAHALGLNCAVCGFSFSQRASGDILCQLNRLPAPIPLYARDPITHRFLAQVLARPVTLAADPAFLLAPDYDDSSFRACEKWVSCQRADGAFVLGLNINHHLVRWGIYDLFKLIEAHRTAITEAAKEIGRPIAVLLIPHDSRGTPSDLTIAQEALKTLQPSVQGRVLLHPFPCSARAVKATVSCLDGVLTGKMHLAIAALGMGVPVAAVTYKDHKFDGLYEHFGLDALTIAPEQASDSSKLAFLVRRIVEDNAAIRNTIAAQLPRIQELAKANFDFLR